MVEFLHKKGFGDVTEDLNQKLSDEQYNLLVAEFSQDKTIREEANRLIADKEYLNNIYKEGAERASYIANKTLRKVDKKIGFYQL